VLDHRGHLAPLGFLVPERYQSLGKGHVLTAQAGNRIFGDRQPGSQGFSLRQQCRNLGIHLGEGWFGRSKQRSGPLLAAKTSTP
jgi:hypothetical protein